MKHRRKGVRKRNARTIGGWIVGAAALIGLMVLRLLEKALKAIDDQMQLANTTLSPTTGRATLLENAIIGDATGGCHVTRADELGYAPLANPFLMRGVFTATPRHTEGNAPCAEQERNSQRRLQRPRWHEVPVELLANGNTTLGAPRRC